MTDNLGADHLFDKAEDFRLESDFKNAEEHYQLALAGYTEEDNILGRANVLRGLGELYRLEDNYDEALSYFQSAMGLYQSESHKSQVTDNIYISFFTWWFH